MANAAASAQATTTHDLSTAVAAVRHVLGQLRREIDRLDDDDYTRKPIGVFEASIGGHVRHCLDHIASLLRASESGQLNYDDRERDTEVERQRREALSVMDQLDARLGKLMQAQERPLRMAGVVSGDGAAVSCQSTLVRETMFVLSHTVHHNALIAGMIRLLGVEVDPQFGYAPSTTFYLNTTTSCAR